MNPKTDIKELMASSIHVAAYIIPLAHAGEEKKQEFLSVYGKTQGKLADTVYPEATDKLAFSLFVGVGYATLSSLTQLGMTKLLKDPGNMAATIERMHALCKGVYLLYREYVKRVGKKADSWNPTAWQLSAMLRAFSRRLKDGRFQFDAMVLTEGPDGSIRKPNPKPKPKTKDSKTKGVDLSKIEFKHRTPNPNEWN